MSVAGIIPAWPAPPNIRALSTVRGGGVSKPPYLDFNLGAHVGDDPACVRENRRRLRDRFELPGEPAWLQQVHGTRIVDLDAAVSSVEADAAVTHAANRICIILTADCLPVLFTDTQGSCVAAAHAGWRGLLGGVLETTTQAMGVSPHCILAWLGPAIGPAHFEVGAEVRDQFIASHPEAETAFNVNARGRFLADLFLLARQRLQRAGVEQVFGGGECTFSDPARFFSHRRDRLTGRQATLIWRASP